MKDIYAKVTNSIIAALELGTPPWIRPWQDSGDAIPIQLENPVLNV
ncbi:MAG: ArdC family protein [Gallionella sp.]|nr:ArdC family protein [Gallionella sp.]